MTGEEWDVHGLFVSLRGSNGVKRKGGNEQLLCLGL
jgi:hypothetical protein